jgi:hypothetical protein
MEAVTSSPKLAQAARERIGRRALGPQATRFAGKFPYLIESCGLAHAVALAKAQGHVEYLEDLAAVLSAMGQVEAASAESLEQATLHHSVTGYVHLSHNTLQAALYLNECLVEAYEGHTSSWPGQRPG